MANYKVVDAEQLDADLKTVADSIRSKGGTTGKLEFPQGMKQAVEAIQSGSSNNDALNQLLNGNIEQISTDVNRIRKEAFNSCTALKSVDLNLATQIEENAFKNCTSLETINAPKVNVIWNYAFTGLNKLKNINIPEINILRFDCFSNCISLEEFPYMPKVTHIFNAFAGCTGLKVVKFHSILSQITSNSFKNCINITDIYVPWSEGEVADSPWGAENATIHYNTVYDENHNPIV